MTNKRSGFQQITERSEALGLSVRRAVLYKGKSGCGYMFSKDNKDLHWCHSIEQAKTFLANYRATIDTDHLSQI